MVSAVWAVGVPVPAGRNADMSGQTAYPPSLARASTV